MKTDQKTGAYIAPELSVLEMKAEGVLCGSDSPWYESEGIETSLMELKQTEHGCRI